MNINFFDIHSFEKNFYLEQNKTYGFELNFIATHLSLETVNLVTAPVICTFVNDKLDRPLLTLLHQKGVKLIALRCAGFNHVDLQAAKEFNITIVRVPEYSPHAVAEYAVALLMTLNRKIHRAHQRVREGNFDLNHLVGFDLYQKTIGVIGTGKIGKVFCQIMKGFGCKILAYDPYPDEQLGVEYVTLNTLFSNSDIISLHCPLTAENHHLINKETIARMKNGVFLINTGRGGLIDTHSLIQALKNKKIAGAGLDVYEEEAHYFFEDKSSQPLDDDMLARLITFPNVLLTGHQAFLTQEALGNIASTTFENISDFMQHKPLKNQVLPLK